MNYALDLTPRQAARALEQAVRARARVELEPRNRPDSDVLSGVIGCRQGFLLRIDLPTLAPGAILIDLIGSFCDARVEMGDELYLFTTNVLDVVDDLEPPRLLLASPEHLQVLNRRRFERTNAVIASQARVLSVGHPTAVGLLASVSASGVALNLPGVDADDYLYVGDAVRVNFELAGFPGRFELPAVICNKSFNADRSVLTTGLEFALDAADASAAHELARLQAALCELTTQLSESEGDA